MSHRTLWWLMRAAPPVVLTLVGAPFLLTGHGSPAVGWTFIAYVWLMVIPNARVERLAFKDGWRIGFVEGALGDPDNVVFERQVLTDRPEPEPWDAPKITSLALHLPEGKSKP